jgi:quinol-cytochrome oxidoreductase complex cytochrome b subunit
MSQYVKSSPHFFRPVGRSMVLGIAALLVLAALVPAPLGTPADPAHAPNPAKSAWFLLWIQELVSYSTLAVYVAVGLAAFLFALPWLPARKLEHARWLPREHRPLGLAVLAAALLVLTLTLVGLYLRGPDWRLVLPS